MKKSLFILSIVFLSWQIDSNLLEWRLDRKLTWNDFRGIPPTNSYNEAITASGIEFTKTSSGDTVIIRVKSYFDKDNSWVKIKSATEFALKHEQGHFDISEYFARKIKKELYELFKQDTISKNESTIIYDKNITAMNLYQELYDKETNHSINIEKQLEWNAQIEKQLVELERWSNFQPYYCTHAKIIKR